MQKGVSWLMSIWKIKNAMWRASNAIHYQWKKNTWVLHNTVKTVNPFTVIQSMDFKGLYLGYLLEYLKNLKKLCKGHRTHFTVTPKNALLYTENSQCTPTHIVWTCLCVHVHQYVQGFRVSSCTLQQGLTSVVKVEDACDARLQNTSGFSLHPYW